MIEKKITKEELIRSISESSKTPIFMVRRIYDCIENEVRERLSKVNKSQSVTIKLFEGLTIKGEYVPQKKVVSNLPQYSDKNQVSPEKIKPTAKFSRRYGENLSNLLTKK